MEKRLAFAYGRSIVLSRIIPLAVLTVLIALAVLLGPSFSALIAAGLGIMLAVYLVLFGLSPLLTEHWVTRSRIILRQGWYMRVVVPVSEVRSIKAADEVAESRVPLGIHRPLGQPTLFVTAGRTNLVALRLRKPRRFWQSFGLSANEIVFDVNDRPGFLAAVEERRALLAPVKADRTDPELRD